MDAANRAIYRLTEIEIKNNAVDLDKRILIDGHAYVNLTEKLNYNGHFFKKRFLNAVKDGNAVLTTQEEATKAKIFVREFNGRYPFICLPKKYSVIDAEEAFLLHDQYF